MKKIALSKKLIALIFGSLILILENNLSQALTFGYDQYLGFPTKDPKIIHEFNAHHISIKPYSSMDAMVTDLKNNRLDLAFIPAGAQYYLTHNLNYEGLVSTTTSLHHQNYLTSYLLVTKESGFNNIKQLQGKNLYYLNNSCTTSYFAPMIYLHSQHINMSKYFIRLIPVSGFYAQLPALIKSKTNTTMLWADIWELSPKLAEMTRIIAQIKGLPTPVLLISKNINQQLKDELYQFFIHYHKSDAFKWRFYSFIPYQTEKNKNFINQIHQSIKNKER